MRMVAGEKITIGRVAKMIDHSLLRPELTRAEVLSGCELAAEYNVASVCVRPADVPFAADLLRGTDVLVGTVVGFPHGSSRSRTKITECEVGLADGAREFDMVINIGLLRSGLIDEVEDDIAAVVAATGRHKVKVILETSYLTDPEKIAACLAAERARADFVKTSTGFSSGGATIHDLRLMRETVSHKVAVKASGGVRTLDVLLEMADIGATRFGATRTKEMLDDLEHRLKYGAPAPAPSDVATGGDY